MYAVWKTAVLILHPSNCCLSMHIADVSMHMCTQKCRQPHLSTWRLRNQWNWAVYIHTYKHINIHTYVHTYILTYVRTCERTYEYTYIHAGDLIRGFDDEGTSEIGLNDTYIYNTYIHTYILTYLRVYMHTYIHIYLNTCRRPHPWMGRPRS